MDRRDHVRRCDRRRWIQGCTVPRRMKIGFIAALWLGGALVVACSEGNGAANCLPEDVERCTCADGRSGFSVCDPTAGRGYDVCNCEIDASPYLPEAGVETEAGDAGADAGGLTFMSPCSMAPGAPMCPPGTSCDAFPAKGPHCSKACTEATDCPAPSTGCNMMGICKAP
jgi:hypothetical protein